MTFIIIILLLSLVFIIGALVYFGNKNSRKQKKAFSDEMQKIADKYSFSWDKVDLSRNRALAWNSAQRIFLHGAWKENTPLLHLILMDDVQHFELSETIVLERDQDNKMTHRNVTELSLAFSFKDKAKSNQSLGFYSEIIDGVMERNNQTQKAKEWLALMRNSVGSAQVQ